jgi:hypothetical protein
LWRIETVVGQFFLNSWYAVHGYAISQTVIEK